MSTGDCQLNRTKDFGTIRIMTDPATKLRQLRIASGYKTIAEAAARHGWNVNTYKSHENGMRPISKKAAAKYANAYKVLPGWLLYNLGPKAAVQQSSGEVFKGTLVGQPVTAPRLINQEIGIAHRRIPRLDWEIMARMTNINEAIADATDFYLVPAEDQLPSLSFSIKITDDSMLATNVRSEDSFRLGDNALFSPQIPVSPGNYVLAKIFARNETVFRQYREKGYDPQGRKIISLHALNAAWGDETIVLGVSGEIIARLIRNSRDYS